jgi:endonuclease-3
MATLAMVHAWHEDVGIGVDVHVHRIANRLGWCATTQPEKTEAALQAVFPKELWEPLNETVVGFGQTICAARKPKCSHCPIADTCRSRADLEDAPAPRRRRRKREQSESEAEAESSGEG